MCILFPVIVCLDVAVLVRIPFKNPIGARIVSQPFQFLPQFFRRIIAHQVCGNLLVLHPSKNYHRICIDDFRQKILQRMYDSQNFPMLVCSFGE